MKTWVEKQKGFTIVELLIAIVVIAILAAISIVAYNGIQVRGRDASRASDVNSIQKALSLYYVDEGKYPACGVPGTSCNSPALASYLVPKYIQKMPADSTSTATYSYVTNTDGDGYGMRILYEKGTCRYLVGSNTTASWYGSATPFC